MKKNKPPVLYEAMGNISDTYISEAASATGVKTSKRPRVIACIAACLALVLVLPSVFLIASLRDPLKAYRNDPYYTVIASIVQGQNEAAYLAKLQEKPMWERIFGMFWAKAGDIASPKADRETGAVLSGNMIDSVSDRQDDVITDNQVEGVLEADIIKRNDSHIFYLHGNDFRIYTLDGENSKEIAAYAMNAIVDGVSVSEFYLIGSKLVFEGVYHSERGAFTKLLQLSVDDLLDGTVDEEPTGVSLQGSLISTRFAGDDLIVMSGYYYNGDVDFDSDLYLPHYESDNGMVAISPDKITAPDGPATSNYTALYLLSGDTLAVKDARALLGTPSAQYVSQNTVYLVSESTALYTEDGEAKVFVYEFNTERNCVKTKTVSHVEAVSYSADGFRSLGSVSLDGSVKDQYSMDEYEGVLRVAASTSEWSYVLNEAGTRSNGSRRERNASLYLVSLEDFSILSAAHKFAPYGETVQSARFDKTLAYICTAQIVTFTDPVYRFDLSDPTRIHSLDTGTIDGYSTSLVELANGDLLGIGYGNDETTLKLEIYRKGEVGLDTVTSYELMGCEFSEDYKSYYINREASLFGIPVHFYRKTVNGVTYYESEMKYLLFSYDGESLTIANEVSLGVDYYVHSARGFAYDGNLYVLYSSAIQVAPVGCATNG